MKRLTPTIVKQIYGMISSYVADKRLPELDALQQWSSTLIEERYIVENLEARYGPDGSKALGTALSKVYETGLSRSETSDILAFYLRGKEPIELFKQEILSRVKSASTKEKEVLTIFLHAYRLGNRIPFDPTGFLQSCEWSLRISKNEAEKALVKSGLVNKFWYKSRRFSHPAWESPPWTSEILLELIRRPEEYGLKPDIIEELLTILTKERNELTRWIVEQFGTKLSGYISFEAFEKEKRYMDEKYGAGKFFEYIKALIRTGRMAITGYDSRFGYFISLDPVVIKELEA